eukprot:2317642-Pyramimonas_sp.AAC.1
MAEHRGRGKAEDKEGGAAEERSRGPSPREVILGHHQQARQGLLGGLAQAVALQDLRETLWLVMG